MAPDSLYCGKRRKSRAMTLTLVQQCPISNLSEIFSYTAKYSNFMFLDRFFLSYLTKKHRNTHTQTHTDSDENSGTYRYLCFAKTQLLIYESLFKRGEGLLSSRASVSACSVQVKCLSICIPRSLLESFWSSFTPLIVMLKITSTATNQHYIRFFWIK